MFDHRAEKHPHAGKHIDINNPKEFHNWCEVFGCSEGELSAAVGIVGTCVVRVKKYISKLIK